MKNLVRAAAAVGAAIGIAAFAAPAASAAPVAPAAVEPGQVSLFPLSGELFRAPYTPGGGVYIVFGDFLNAFESGPGNQAAYLNDNSEGLDQSAQNEKIETGDIKTQVSGEHNNVPVEVEGSEQDQGEGA